MMILFAYCCRKKEEWNGTLFNYLNRNKINEEDEKKEKKKGKNTRPCNKTNKENEIKEVTFCIENLGGTICSLKLVLGPTFY